MFALRKPKDGEDISQYEAFDFTKLSAINTCPRWGIIRYGHHRVISTKSRAMALEAGEACHQAFAAARFYDLVKHGVEVYGGEVYESQKAAIWQRSCDLFGSDRARTMFKHFLASDDERTNLLRGVLHILETSGFVDDPMDNRRTMDNLVASVITYLDRYEFGEHIPYMANGFIGIENPFNTLVTYDIGNAQHRTCRLTGRIDGFHLRKNNLDDPYIEENKTASRLNDAWELSFETSHQVTGYVIAGSIETGKQISRAIIYGLSIPQPKVTDSGGYETIQVRREARHLNEWAKWFIYTAEEYFKFRDDPINAPMFTHSCNRYFRPCSYIPLCTGDESERKEMFNDMAIDEWSPLKEKVVDDA